MGVIPPHPNLRYYGPYGKARITIFPLEPMLDPLAAADELARRVDGEITWGPATNLLSPEQMGQLYLPGERGVVGVGPPMLITLVIPDGMTALDALKSVEAHLGGLPAALAAGLLAASEMDQRNIAPSVLAAYMASAGPAVGLSVLNTRQIRAMAQAWIQGLLADKRAGLPAAAVDRARTLLSAGRLLWKEAGAAAAGRALRGYDAPLDHEDMTQGPLDVLVLSGLAEALRFVDAITEVQIADTTLALVDDAMDAWAQFAELAAGPLTKSAAHFLCGKQFPYVDGRFAWYHPDESIEGPEMDARLATQWSEELVAEAERDGVFAPVGGFVLRFPVEYPLRQWGIEGLRLYADPQGMWVSLAPDRAMNLVRWEPRQPLSPALIPPALAPALHVTLAALWRDLCVAGEEVVRVRSQGQDVGSRHSQRRERVVVVPRRRVVYLDGERTWGDDEERDAVTRQRHKVSHSFPRLQPGQQRSEAAEREARRWGWLVIPEGRTFRVPHERGGKKAEGAEQQEAPRLVAQGLRAATLFLWSITTQQEE